MNKKMTLSALVKFLNETKVKKTHNKFTVSDVQAYINRGHLPKYLGGNIILKNTESLGVSLYTIK